MNKLIDQLATGVALLGVIVTVGSGLARFFGLYLIGPFESITIFNGGMGLMLIGIVGKLHTQKPTS